MFLIDPGYPLASFPPPKVIFLDNYGGIFYCYTGSHTIKEVILKDTFTADWLYYFVKRYYEDLIDIELLKRIYTIIGVKDEKQTCHGQ